MTASRFNPNHAAAGSANGGQFTSSSGSGSGSKAKAGKAAAKKAAAHQAHVAHEAHLAHEKYLASHPSTPAARAQQKAQLLDAAKADRAKVTVLEKQLKGLQDQEKKAAATAKHTKAAAANAKAGPKQKRTLAHAATVASKKHATVRQQISTLQQQIKDLNVKAAALESQAAKL